MTDIEERVERIEQALVAIGALQFGDSAGHPFRGNQWTAGEGGSIKDIADHVRGQYASRFASEHTQPDDLKAMASAAAQHYDEQRLNEVTARGGIATGPEDLPRGAGVDQAPNADAQAIRNVRDNPVTASNPDAQRVANYLERSRGGDTESDQIDWNEVGRNEYV